MAGMYLHIPFCKQRCSYCDFHFSTSFRSYRTEMVDAMCEEIKMRVVEIQKETIETIYFGGGTPSLLLESELKLLFTTIRKSYRISESAEISLEANPDDISLENLRIWKNLGFNRLSIGLQSFRAEDLLWMNRAHSTEEALNCVRLAKNEGFTNISVDLIYGLPNLNEATWQNHIATVIELGVTHVSAYCLTVEKKTLLEKKVQAGSLVVSDEDQQSDQFLQLVKTLKQSGFEQYEISNFCKPGFESQHNSSYWKGTHYIGIGPSAHSFNGSQRRFNNANNKQYIRAISLRKIYFDLEELTPVMQFNEAILTGLRTKWGLSLLAINEILRPSKNFHDRTNSFMEKGWLKLEDQFLFLQNDGWLMADYIASELFENEEN